MARQILVTSALPYANGPLHLGHIIEAVQTDVWVRFQKMQGNDCLYVCAEDTHGTPIMIKAQTEGVTPEVLIARVATRAISTSGVTPSVCALIMMGVPWVSSAQT